MTTQEEVKDVIIEMLISNSEQLEEISKAGSAVILNSKPHIKKLISELAPEIEKLIIGIVSLRARAVIATYRELRRGLEMDQAWEMTMEFQKSSVLSSIQDAMKAQNASKA